MTIPAKYENGVFKPLEKVDLPEGALVEVRVPESGTLSEFLRNSPLAGSEIDITRDPDPGRPVDL